MHPYFGANCGRSEGKFRQEKQQKGGGMHGRRMGKSPKENERGRGEIRRETMYLVSTFQVGLHRLVCIQMCCAPK